KISLILLQSYLTIIIMNDSTPYKILVAIEETELSCKALKHAFDLCSRLNTPYSLEVVYVIALNPEANPNVQYKFNKLEGHGVVGKILKDYVETHMSDLNLLIVGSRDLDTLKKIVLSSTSDYLIKHLQCPVTIVKP
ncbi:5598_t:CDS:2, partial [Scutellospora calospora]